MGSDDGVTNPTPRHALGALARNSRRASARCHRAAMDTPTPRGARDPTVDPDSDTDLTIAPALHPAHADLLREHLFEDAGLLGRALKSDALDGVRVVYGG